MNGYQIYMSDKNCKCKKPVKDSEVLTIDSHIFKLEFCITCNGILKVGESVHEIEFYNNNITL